MNNDENHEIFDRITGEHENEPQFYSMDKTYTNSINPRVTYNYHPSNGNSNFYNARGAISNSQNTTENQSANHTRTSDNFNNYENPISTMKVNFSPNITKSQESRPPLNSFRSQESKVFMKTNQRNSMDSIYKENSKLANIMSTLYKERFRPNP